MSLGVRNATNPLATDFVSANFTVAGNELRGNLNPAGVNNAATGIGLIYGNRKQLQEASFEFDKVLKLDPKFDPNIYFLLVYFTGSVSALPARMAFRSGPQGASGD